MRDSWIDAFIADLERTWIDAFIADLESALATERDS